MEITESKKEYIRKQLQHGDRARVARIAEVTRKYVGDVVGTKHKPPRRTTDSQNTKEIWRIAWIIVKQQDELTHK